MHQQLPTRAGQWLTPITITLLLAWRFAFCVVHDKQVGIKSSYKEKSGLSLAQKLINMFICPCASVMVCGAVR